MMYLKRSVLFGSKGKAVPRKVCPMLGMMIKKMKHFIDNLMDRLHNVIINH